MCVLFSLYLNDLEDFFQINDINGLKSISDEVETELNYYLKLIVIVYADDSVLMSKSQEDLQKQLDSLNEYCHIWKLKVNVGKSKVVIFSKGRMSKNIVSMYNNTVLEIVNGGSMSLIT